MLLGGRDMDRRESAGHAGDAELQPAVLTQPQPSPNDSMDVLLASATDVIAGQTQKSLSDLGLLHHAVNPATGQDDVETSDVEIRLDGDPVREASLEIRLDGYK